MCEITWILLEKVEPSLIATIDAPSKTSRRWKITRDSIRPIVRDVRIGHHRPDLQHYRQSSQPDRLSGDISLDGDGERDAAGSQRSSPASRRVSCISGQARILVYGGSCDDW